MWVVDFETGNPHDEPDDDRRLDAASADADPRVMQLQQELERERARLDSFLKNSSRQEPRSAEPPPLPALGPMPDPTEDPQGFQKWLLDRDARQETIRQRELERIQTQNQTQVAESERRALLWNAFSNRYPAYAKRERLASVAFQTLADSDRLPAGIDGIVEAVKQEMDAIMGTPLQNGNVDRTGGLADKTPPVQVKKKPAKEAEADQPFASTHEASTAWKLKHGLI